MRRRSSSFPSHRRTPARAGGAAGFTLLELLVATAIGAIVLLVINATFFSALRLHNTTHDRIDEDLALQRALGIVRKDLAGIALPGGLTGLAGQLQTTVATPSPMDSNGERISPDLFTTSGQIDGWTAFSELQMVSYFLTPAADGNTKNLVRVVTRNLLPVQDATTDDQTLLTGVTSAAVLFYDGTDWTDTWDSSATNTLPSAIKFSVVLAPHEVNNVRINPDPVELVVPVLVTTSTSQQALTSATP